MPLAVRGNEQINALDNQSQEKEQIFNKPEAVAFSDKDISNEAGDYEKITASEEDSTLNESNVEDNKEAENDQETNDEEEMDIPRACTRIERCSYMVVLFKGKMQPFFKNFDLRLKLEKIP